jgi:thioester reductase-like protein
MPATPLANQTGHIFITGITGTVGCEIGRWLRLHTAGYRVTALIRAASAAELAGRWREVLDSIGGGTAPQGWQAVAGDVKLAGLGLDRDCAAELQRTVTHIIHGAADVRFVAPLADARKINVEGTRNVLLFGARCKKLARFAHLSTLFVAGRRTGRILEGELEDDAGFVNTYEQSKYEAEVMVRGFHGELPVAVYRLALLPGRRRDGYVHHFGSFHMVLYYYSRGLLRMLPGAPQNLIDMAPADWAAETVLRLYFESFVAGRTYHICSAEKAVTMQEFVSLTSSLFSQRGSRAPLELVEVSDYEEFVGIAERQGGTFSSRTRRVLNSTVPHTILSKSFDRSGMTEVFGSRFEAPHFRDYYPKIVRYCLSSDWGRGIARPATSEVAIAAKAGST